MKKYKYIFRLITVNYLRKRRVSTVLYLQRVVTPFFNSTKLNKFEKHFIITKQFFGQHFSLIGDYS